MEFEGLPQAILIVLGLLILWGVMGLVLKLTQRVISCGCSLILALALFYLLLRWYGAF